MPYMVPDPEVKELADKTGVAWDEIQDVVNAVVKRVVEGEERVEWDEQGNEYRVRVSKVDRIKQ